LEDIRVPMFVVGTERDHVSPWRSVHKIHLLTGTDLTFALTTGGHNVGVVNPPRTPSPGIGHWLHRRRPGEAYADPDRWLAQAVWHEGSWWPSWQRWLASLWSVPCAPLPLGGRGRRRLELLGDAPGAYVHAP
jgi:polyhydroxyalkanoate synthase